MSKNRELMGILYRHLQPTQKEGDYLVPIAAKSLTIDCNSLAADLKAFMQDAELKLLADFYNKVCDRAERNMEATGTVSGAHWNAMRQTLKELGVEVTR